MSQCVILIGGGWHRTYKDAVTSNDHWDSRLLMMTGCRQEQCRHVYRPYSDDMNKRQAAYRLNTAHRQTDTQTDRQSGMNHLGNVTTRTHASCTETSLKRTRKATKSNITNTQHITNITTVSNWGRLNADIHPSPVGVLTDRWWQQPAGCVVSG